jgi:hypothetical protein
VAPHEDWDIPRKVWLVLMSWGLAVLLMTSLLSAWVWSNQQRQDHDMCAMISVFLAGPEPVTGPAGERSRTVRAAMKSYSEQRHC